MIPCIETYNRLITASPKPICSIVKNLKYYQDGPAIDKNAQLIKTKDCNKIYLVQFGEKRWITNPTTFKDLGFDYDKVAIVENYVLQLFKDGKDLC